MIVKVLFNSTSQLPTFYPVLVSTPKGRRCQGGKVTPERAGLSLQRFNSHGRYFSNWQKQITQRLSVYQGPSFYPFPPITEQLHYNLLVKHLGSEVRQNEILVQVPLLAVCVCLGKSFSFSGRPLPNVQKVRIKSFNLGGVW